MNREIKFRGLSFDKGWIYGNLIKSDQNTWIRESDYYNFKVKAETVGQFTGLHDKNGKEIYEGDIVYCQTKYGKAKAIIKFIDGKFVAYWDSILTHPQNGHCIACYEINKRFEVIGNIYEDIELLGGE
jgi:uncharacterized phage protein (TIGR01671 family)